VTAKAGGGVRRVLVAFADAAPAFTVPLRTARGGSGRRLLAALSDSTPAFGPAEVVWRDASHDPRQHTIHDLTERIQIDTSISQRPWHGLDGPAIEEMAAQLPKFAPELPDIAPRRKIIDDFIVQMTAPDHAVVHGLDNLVNAWVDEWISSLRTQYLSYRATALHRQNEAKAWLAANQAAVQRNKQRLADAELAFGDLKGRWTRKRMGRIYRKALTADAASRQQLARAESASNRYGIQLDTAQQTVELTTRTLILLGEELKYFARLRIAMGIKDPSARDVILTSQPTYRIPADDDQLADA
jgi:hypothetical protein